MLDPNAFFGMPLPVESSVSITIRGVPVVILTTGTPLLSLFKACSAFPVPPPHI